MNITIYYIIEYPTRAIHLFDWHDDAKAKEQELVDKYGYAEISKDYKGRQISEALNKLCDTIPKYGIKHETLKNYYGTVWYAYYFSEDGKACHLKIAGRFKELKAYKDYENYKIKKKVLVPYDLYPEFQNSHQLKMKDKKEWFDNDQVKEDIEL